uniref:Uncharacterized protein n=1 Tax=Kalanchoe fedtschenkoi TaxID=63787 RepID=A0A7N0TXF7_KALFE
MTMRYQPMLPERKDLNGPYAEAWECWNIVENVPLGLWCDHCWMQELCARFTVGYCQISTLPRQLSLFISCL